MCPNAFSFLVTLVTLSQSAFMFSPRQLPYFGKFLSKLVGVDCYLDTRLWLANLHDLQSDTLHRNHFKPLCPRVLGKEISSLICFPQDMCIWK